MEGLKLSCKKHPKYLAKMAPRVACEECLAMWNLNVIVRKGEAK